MFQAEETVSAKTCNIQRAARGKTGDEVGELTVGAL